MNLFVDLDALQLRASATDSRQVSIIDAKRGDALPLEVRFIQDGAPTRLDVTTTINFAIKEEGKYDQDPLVFEDTFTASAVGSPDSDPHYTATPSLNTAALNALFLMDEDDTNDPASVRLMGELTWQATGDTGPTSTKTFVVRMANDVYRGDEASPAALPDPVAWLTTENTNRGLQPVRTADSNSFLYPPSITISGEILGVGDVPIALEPLVFDAFDGTGRPSWTVTTAESIDLTLQYDNVSKDWDLVVDWGGSPATVTYETSIAQSVFDPTGLVLSATDRTDVTITATSGVLAPKVGDRGYDSSEDRFFNYNGFEWSPEGDVYLGGAISTVADLPVASDNRGRRMSVSDSNLIANSTNYGLTVAGGGANTVPVFSDGTKWIIA